MHCPQESAPRLQRKIAAARQLRQSTRVLDSSKVLFSSEQQSFNNFVEQSEEDEFMRRLDAKGNGKREGAEEQQRQGAPRGVSQMLNFDAKKKRQTQDR